MSGSIKGGLFSCAALAAIAAVTPVAAQSQSATDTVRLEEVLVTARRTTENLLQVPIAISAFTAENLQTQNIKDIVDLQNFTPGFAFGETALRADRYQRTYVIRGINLGGAALAFLDGAPVLGGDIGTFVDVERVEILRGPQAAYFGRNTYSGAINFVTKTPGNTWKGLIEAEYASYGTNTISGTVEGPLVADKLSFRTSVRSEHIGGQYTNAANTSERLGNRNTRAVNLGVYAAPSDRLSIKLYGTAFKFDDGPASHYLFTREQFTCNGGAGTAPNWICGTVPKPDLSKLGVNDIIDDRVRRLVFPLGYFSGGPKTDHAGLVKNNYAVHAIVNYDLPNDWQIGGITAWDYSNGTEIADEDNRDTLNVPNTAANIARGGRTYFNELVMVDFYAKDFSQELRITSPKQNRLRGTFGGSYVYFNNMSSWVTGDQAAGIRNPPVSTGRNVVNTWAGFGGVYFDVMPTVTLGAEARYQWDNVRSISLPPPSTAIANTWKSFSPRVTVDYKPSDDLTVFALWARGYRPGGFNVRFLTLTPAEIAQIVALTGAGLNVEQERLDDFEAGVKSRFLDGRAQIAATLYAGTISNQQVTVINAIFNAQGVPSNIGVTANLAKTKFKGVELEGSFQVSRQLKLTGTFALNDTKLVNYICQACVAIMGSTAAATNHRLPGYAKYTGSATASYTDRFNDTYNWFVRTEYFYQGRKFESVFNLASIQPRSIVNLRLGLESETISFEAYSTNLFNNKTPIDISTLTDRVNGSIPTVLVGLAKKRTFGVRASYNF